jgi:hypothetical protein
MAKVYRIARLQALWYGQRETGRSTAMIWLLCISGLVLLFWSGYFAGRVDTKMMWVVIFDLFASGVVTLLLFTNSIVTDAIYPILWILAFIVGFCTAFVGTVFGDSAST